MIPGGVPDVAGRDVLATGEVRRVGPVGSPWSWSAVCHGCDWYDLTDHERDAKDRLADHFRCDH